MLQYRKINNLTGWIIFALSTLVYFLTLEPTASFWDCGEFIAAAYKLQVPHPPGAPLFLLIGRMFTFLAPDLQSVAVLVNSISALSSSFTILFLFWTITILAKKVLDPDTENPSKGNTILIQGAGIVGSLAFTFTDSFWFSATEAEVYAMSSFFAAFVFWAILKWENNYGKEGNDRWIILIAYMMGLSIGVHLLNLVTIPALGYVYYFKKYKITTSGIILTFLISAAIIGVIMIGIIPGLPSIAGNFEVFFVNSLGLPFNSGTIFFIVLFIALLTYFILYSIKNKKQVLNLILVSFVFILIGYSSYGLIYIRSGFDPPIDENNPENVISFVSYLKREQYGDRPLARGHYFTAGYPIGSEKTTPLYYKDGQKGEYVVYDYKRNYEYDPAHITLFPRAYSIQPGHKEAYISWMGEPKVRVTNADGKPGYRPSMMQNLDYFFSYQIGHMYFRYFLWNFMSRENDAQNAGPITPDQWFNEKIPPYLKDNKARNNFYMLPLILGLLGLFYHYSKNRNDWTIVLLLFFFSGLAIIIYLNQPPIEPRERDYTYTGSFYAFCIWIGFGVLAIADFLKKYLKGETVAPIVATVVSLVVPGILAAEGWDDHNRSNRYHSVDSAKNLLNSCAKNAILFTGGDNDTFPLWYVQEVEGFRTDVRVCNLSLLNTDWYISQMKTQAYDSDPLPITLDIADYRQGTNDQVFVAEDPKYKGGINLVKYMHLVNTGNNLIKRPSGSGDVYTILPSKTLYFPMDKDSLATADFIPSDKKQYLTDVFQWTISQNMLDKKDMIMLDIIANNNWKRPVYFSTTLSSGDFLNLKPYTQLEGLAHRLMPVKVPGASAGWVNSGIMYNNMMHKFAWRGMDNPDVYYDENYLRFPINTRSQFHHLAGQLFTENKKDKAKEVLEYSLKVMPDSVILFDVAIPPYVGLLYKLGEDTLATRIAKTMGDRSIENLEYLAGFKEIDTREIELNLYILDQLFRPLRENGKDKLAKVYEETLQKYVPLIRR